MRNVRIGRRRTSVRLEDELWDALGQICEETGKDINQICTEVARSRGDGGVGGERAGSFASSLRVFILEYFRRPPRGGQAAGPHDPA